MGNPTVLQLPDTITCPLCGETIHRDYGSWYGHFVNSHSADKSTFRGPTGPHKGTYKDSRADDDRSPYFCYLCGCDCEDEDDLKAHLQNQHNAS